jgi:hypothetical protein
MKADTPGKNVEPVRNKMLQCSAGRLIEAWSMSILHVVWRRILIKNDFIMVNKNNEHRETLHRDPFVFGGNAREY